MKAEYWHQRWEEKNIPFHEGRVNGYLKIYFERMNCYPGDRVFVPLCGKALDMKWICDQGCEVLGVELSPIAVAEYFKENEIEFRCSREHPFDVLSGGGATLLCGDVFDMGAAHFQGISGIYDRAAYIAFDPAGRRRYAEFFCAMLPKGAPLLLLTLEYPQSLMDGPPFSVSEAEVRERFTSRYHVVHLETRDIIQKQPRFQQKGLSELLAHAFILNDR
jgi:thiopurine S-methyltransferase